MAGIRLWKGSPVLAGSVMERRGGGGSLAGSGWLRRDATTRLHTGSIGAFWLSAIRAAQYLPSKVGTCSFPEELRRNTNLRTEVEAKLSISS